MNVKDLKEQRVALADKAEDIHRRVQANGGRWGGEDANEFDRIHADIEALTGDIERAERQDQLNRDLVARGHVDDGFGNPTYQPQSIRDDSGRAFNAWARSGNKLVNVSAHDKQLAARCGLDVTANEVNISLGESRAMATTAGGGVGDKAIPKGFVNSLEVARLAFSPMNRVATVVKTGKGNELPFPTANDTGQKGAILAENASVATQDVSISELVLNAYKYSSKLVLVSVELLQDEDIDLEAHLGRMLGERLGRITNEHFTVGTGSSQPNGVVTASTLGKTAAATAAITYGELVDLQHSVDPAYQDNSSWMFNFSTLAALKKLVDGEGRPIWQPAASSGLGSDVPATLLGRPYYVNQAMDSLAAAKKIAVYGDLSKYLIREVKDIQLLRLNERYADSHQVGFLAYMRTDGDLLDAGTHPVKHLITAAS